MADSDQGLLLDPFGFMPSYASAIKPLGGATAGPDPRYALHTPYVPFPAGRVRFTVRITGLKASGGELHLHVHGFVADSGRDAVLVTSARMHLVEQDVIEHVLYVRCVAGVSYAVYGFIPDAGKISASSVEVFALEEDENGWGGYSEALDGRSAFGTELLDRPTELISKATPTFAAPVSQCLTAKQLSEDAFLEWRRRLPTALSIDEAWSAAQTLQALRQYGMLSHGARGIGLCDGDGLLDAILAEQGCETIAYALADGYVISPSRTDSPEAATAAERESWNALDELPVSVRGFDFLWSLQTLERLPDHREVSRFVERSLLAVRQGGYALFGLRMVDRPGRAAAPTDGALTRGEIERLALTLISRAHDVAQLNFAGDEADGPRATGAETPFILVVRRSLASI